MIAVLGRPLQITWLSGVTTFGVGLTVIVKLCGVPVQVAVDGVTVTVAMITEDVAFVAVNEDISPVPLVPSPIVPSLFVQLKVVPATEPLKVTAAVDVVLHTV